MSTRLNLSTLFLAVGMPLAVVAEGDRPLSAIDWLSSEDAQQSLRAPEPPVSRSALPDQVATSSIGSVRRDAIGLLPAQITGLPASLWGDTRVDELTALIEQQEIVALPSVQALLMMALLAEADAPLAAVTAGPPPGDGAVFRARVAKLIEFGAIDQAAALLEQVDPHDVATFGQAFDVSLLLWREDQTCARLMKSPEIAPTLSARIFCLARSGDWNTAALTLESGRAVGALDPDSALLLAHFLQTEDPEPGRRPRLPQPVSPLAFRIMDAIAEPLPTNAMPLAFSHSDLRDTAGWKSQIEAAERLTRVGAVPGRRLFEIYSDRLPAASGGVWDRVSAVQVLIAAIGADNPVAVGNALPDAWSAMRSIQLEVAFARHFGPQIWQVMAGSRTAPLAPGGQSLPQSIPGGDTPGAGVLGPNTDLAFRILMLSDQAEEVAQAWQPEQEGDRLLRDLAMGRHPAPDQAANTMEEAILLSAEPATPPSDEDPAAAAARHMSLGETILEVALLLRRGIEADPGDVTRALQLLRDWGLESTARAASLELLLLGDEA
ncbi:hypothetical protein ATO5_03070 [Loktanella sp. 22II-4b]|nr:hypothetical protein ATO5_03070 [Loktanella sp. 22II-4b]PJJ86760.1 hypothetical protein CLV77_1317 [Brevirhabdus pacifica]